MKVKRELKKTQKKNILASLDELLLPRHSFAPKRVMGQTKSSLWPKPCNPFGYMLLGY